MFPKICCCYIASDIPLPELFHHLRMLDAFGCLQLIAILFEKIAGYIECGALVSVTVGFVVSFSVM